LGLLIADLCFNFGAAVSAGIQSPYLANAYASYLTSSSTDSITVSIVAACRFTTFECVITFILAIPIDVVIILAFTHRWWNDE
jgi:hypothetical protein